MIAEIMNDDKTVLDVLSGTVVQKCLKIEDFTSDHNFTGYTFVPALDRTVSTFLSGSPIHYSGPVPVPVCCVKYESLISRYEHLLNVCPEEMCLSKSGEEVYCYVRMMNLTSETSEFLDSLFLRLLLHKIYDSRDLLGMTSVQSCFMHIEGFDRVVSHIICNDKGRKALDSVAIHPYAIRSNSLFTADIMIIRSDLLNDKILFLPNSENLGAIAIEDDYKYNMSILHPNLVSVLKF